MVLRRKTALDSVHAWGLLACIFVSCCRIVSETAISKTKCLIATFLSLFYGVVEVSFLIVGAGRDLVDFGLIAKGGEPGGLRKGESSLADGRILGVFHHIIFIEYEFLF